MNELARFIQERTTCGQALVQLFVAATAILLVSGFLAFMFRKQSAALRHRVWTLSTTALLALPILAILLPNWGPAPTPVVDLSEEIVTEQLPSESEPTVASGPVFIPAEGDESLEYPSEYIEPHSYDTRSYPYPSNDFPEQPNSLPESLEPTESEAEASVAIEAPLTEANDGEIENVPVVAATATSVGSTRTGEVIELGLISIWLIGLVIGLLTFMKNQTTAARIVRRGLPIDDTALRLVFERLQDKSGMRCHVPLICSPEISAPVTIGWLRPVIALPSGYGLCSPERLRVVLAHEAAHVRRRDVLSQLIARLARVVYWPHPLVWLANWRIRVEREIACDDTVLELGESPERYATHLVEVAESLRKCSRPPRHAAAMATRSSLEHRVRAILRPSANRKPVAPRTGFILAVGMLIVLVSLSLMSPSTEQKADAAKDAEQIGTEETSDLHVSSESRNEDDPLQGEPITFYKAVVHGVVVDELGTPVSGAVISFQKSFDSMETETSDAEGRFTLPLFYPHSSTIPKLVSASDGSLGFFTLPENLQPGDVMPPQTITLKPPRKIAVKVVNVIGGPVPDADVVLRSTFLTVANITTDEEGRGSFSVAQGLPLDCIMAQLEGVGIDYCLFQRSFDPPDHPYRLPQNHDEEIVLAFTPTRPMTVETVDPNGDPVAGTKVQSSFLTLTDHGGQASFGRHWIRLTNENGVATFDIPYTFEDGISLDVSKEGYIFDGFSNYPVSSGDYDYTTTLLPLVPVTGKVFNPDGSPAVNMPVRASSSGYASKSAFMPSTTTSNHGEFQLYVAPNGYCLFKAGNEKWASPVETRLVLSDGLKEEVELKLRPATRLFGQIVSSEDGRPLKRESVYFNQYACSPEEGGNEFVYGRPELSQDWGKRSIRGEFVRAMITDRNGRYEFYVGPGDFSVSCDAFSPSEIFTITDELEVERNITITPEEESPAPASLEEPESPEEEQPVQNTTTVTFLVVNESGTPVQDAIITRGYPAHITLGRTNTEGRLTHILQENEILRNRSFYAEGPGELLGFLVVPNGIYPGDPVPLQRIEVKTPRRIDARVLDAEGRPVSGAKVLLESILAFEVAIIGETNAEGRVSLSVPDGHSLRWIIAEAEQHGIDYFLYQPPSDFPHIHTVMNSPHGFLPTSPEEAQWYLPQESDEEIVFSLSPTRTVTVKIADADGVPLSDVKLGTYALLLPDKGGLASGMIQGATTNEEGVATYYVAMSAENSLVSAYKEGFLLESHIDVCGVSDVEATLYPLTPVTGRVLYPDGSPAADIPVQAISKGHSMLAIHPDSTRTAEDGTFKLMVNPCKRCFFLAGNPFLGGDKAWASPLEARAVSADEPVEEIELTLQPTTRVFGLLSNRENGNPLSRDSVSLDQYAELNNSSEVGGSSGVRPRFSQHVLTDEEGRFEFYVGPGNFGIKARPYSNEAPLFTIVDGQDEFEIDIEGTPKEPPIVLEETSSTVAQPVFEESDTSEEEQPDKNINETEESNAQTVPLPIISRNDWIQDLYVGEQGTLASTYGGIYIASQGTQSWQQLSMPATIPSGGRFVVESPESEWIYYIAPKHLAHYSPESEDLNFGIYRMHPDGADWELVSSEYDFRDVLPHGDNLYAIVEIQEEISAESADDMIIWTSEEETSNGKKTIYYERVYISEDDGETWRDISNNIGRGMSLYRIMPDPDNEELICLEANSIRTYILQASDDEYHWEMTRVWDWNEEHLTNESFFGDPSLLWHNEYMLRANLSNYFDYSFGANWSILPFTTQVIAPDSVLSEEPIQIEIEIRSYPGTESVTIFDMSDEGFWGIRRITPGGEREVFAGALQDSLPNEEELRTTYRGGIRNSPDMQRHKLKPNQPYRRTLDLTQICDFDEPGVYKIQVYYDDQWIDFRDEGGLNGRIASETFEIEIQE
jgi:beta-lactamase regulating signal transducer with metallopeptidase domain